MSERRCLTCAGAMVARRSTRRYCSGACRTRAYRHRLAIGSVELRACRVEPITRAEAARIILPREHLGTLGRARVFYGLRIPDGRLIGAVGFGPGAHASGGDVVLERGTCLPGAPRNAGSFLIGRAIRHGSRAHGWGHVRAYSDERFGEEGLAYRAAGFTPCPPSRHGKAFRYGLVAGGRVLSDRAIARRFGSYGAARAAGAAIVRLPARVALVDPEGGAPMTEAALTCETVGRLADIAERMAFVRLRRRQLGVTGDLVASSRTAAGPRQRFVACLGHTTSGSKLRPATCSTGRATGSPPCRSRRPSGPRPARYLCTALRRLGATLAHQLEVALAHTMPRTRAQPAGRRVLTLTASVVARTPPPYCRLTRCRNSCRRGSPSRLSRL